MVQYFTKDVIGWLQSTGLKILCVSFVIRVQPIQPLSIEDRQWYNLYEKVVESEHKQESDYL